MNKYQVPYKLTAPMGGVTLTEGRFRRAFDNNISFLKGFDLDRMLYWYRVHAGRRAPGAPYSAQQGHFENNLKGQTAGEFLMGACTSLLWREDAELRETVGALIEEMDQCKDPDGFIIPIPREEIKTKEYPNYTRAWIQFGLLDAGYVGEQRGFELARGMGDWFNQSEILPYVKDMNLGFQGILANTRLYDAPVGVWQDMQVAIDHYQENWWLEQVIAKDHRAIYDHPGNHPHSTLLTTLEGYLDLYRATGDKLYIDAVRTALGMYEDKWQHVGGGIDMCEHDNYYPGCHWLSPNRMYNELCSTNFWVLINQRMHRLFPLESHYVDEMENSLYNVLLAAQVGDQGYHYLNFLERSKDDRWTDRASCCASLGTRLMGLLPQFLYSYDEASVHVDMYAASEARLPLASGEVCLRCETKMPDDGGVRLGITNAHVPFALHLRIPRWAAGSVEIRKNGFAIAQGEPGSYVTLEGVASGDKITFELSMAFTMTRYAGGEQIYGKERWAMERGPLLYAAMGVPSEGFNQPGIHNPLGLSYDPARPDEWLVPMGARNGYEIRGDLMHEYWAYLDIGNEPFSVYPVIEPPTLGKG